MEGGLKGKGLRAKRLSMHRAGYGAVAVSQRTRKGPRGEDEAQVSSRRSNQAKGLDVEVSELQDGCAPQGRAGLTGRFPWLWVKELRQVSQCIIFTCRESGRNILSTRARAGNLIDLEKFPSTRKPREIHLFS